MCFMVRVWGGRFKVPEWAKQLRSGTSSAAGTLSRLRRSPRPRPGWQRWPRASRPRGPLLRRASRSRCATPCHLWYWPPRRCRRSRRWCPESVPRGPCCGHRRFQDPAGRPRRRRGSRPTARSHQRRNRSGTNGSSSRASVVPEAGSIRQSSFCVEGATSSELARRIHRPRLSDRHRRRKAFRRSVDRLRHYGPREAGS